MQTVLAWYIAKSIRTARKARSLSQAELADMLPVARTSIVQYEAAKQSPSIEMLYRIAMALEISVTDLLPPTGDYILKSVEEAILDAFDRGTRVIAAEERAEALRLENLNLEERALDAEAENERLRAALKGG